MRHLQLIPWHEVKPGTVVMLDIPRTVAAITVDPSGFTAYVEGLAPFRPAVRFAQPVELDTADAIGTLYAAGLNPTPIEGAS